MRREGSRRRPIAPSTSFSAESEKAVEEPIWLGGRMAPEVVTEGLGWHEQVADRAECGVGYAGTGRDRRSAVAELGKRVAAAEAAFGLPGVTVVRRRLSVHDQWRGNRGVGGPATEDGGLRVGRRTPPRGRVAALVGGEAAGPTR